VVIIIVQLPVSNNIAQLPGLDPTYSLMLVVGGCQIVEVISMTYIYMWIKLYEISIHLW